MLDRPRHRRWTPRTLVQDRSVAEQQMLEIAKAIGDDMKLLILDEPTAALDEAGVRGGCSPRSRSCASDGRRGRLHQPPAHEVFDSRRPGGRAARRHRRPGGAVPAESSEREVVAAMVGRTVEDFYPKETHSTDRVVLTSSGLAARPTSPTSTSQVHAGEVLGIGGVVGLRQGQPAASLFGLLPVTGGEIRLEDRVLRPAAAARRSRRDRLPDPRPPGRGPVPAAVGRRQRLAGHPRPVTTGRHGPPRRPSAGPRRDHADGA